MGVAVAHRGGYRVARRSADPGGMALQSLRDVPAKRGIVPAARVGADDLEARWEAAVRVQRREGRQQQPAGEVAARSEEREPL